MNIKRYDFVTLNEPTPHFVGAPDLLPAGTKLRVWKVQRNGAVWTTVVDGGTNINCVIHKSKVTKLSGPPTLKESVKVGDIYVCSWGYGQTNIDYYQITQVLNASVKYRSIGGKRTYDGHMNGSTVPIKDSFDGSTEQIARLRSSSDGRPSFRINSYSWAYKWDGKPDFFSEWN